MKQIFIPKNGNIDIFPVISWIWVRYLFIQTTVKYPESKYSLKRITMISVQLSLGDVDFERIVVKTTLMSAKYLYQVTLT